MHKIVKAFFFSRLMFSSRCNTAFSVVYIDKFASNHFLNLSLRVEE